MKYLLFDFQYNILSGLQLVLYCIYMKIDTLTWLSLEVNVSVYFISNTYIVCHLISQLSTFITTKLHQNILRHFFLTKWYIFLCVCVYGIFTKLHWASIPGMTKGFFCSSVIMSVTISCLLYNLNAKDLISKYFCMQIANMNILKGS